MTTATVPATLYHRREDWRAAVDGARAAGGPVALVPTGTVLHGGPLSVIRRAAATCPCVAVTLADAPGRDLDADAARAGRAGATHLVVVGTPDPCGPVAEIAAGGETQVFVGEKDPEAVAAVRRLVGERALPVTVLTTPVVRTSSGLALSGANDALAADERERAVALYRALLAGKRAVEEDLVVDPDVVEAVVAAALRAAPGLEVERVAVRAGEDLDRPAVLGGEVRLLVTARLGGVRLDDTLVATVPEAVPAATAPPPAGAHPAAGGDGEG